MVETFVVIVLTRYTKLVGLAKGEEDLLR